MAFELDDGNWHPRSPHEVEALKEWTVEWEKSELADPSNSGKTLLTLLTGFLVGVFLFLIAVVGMPLFMVIRKWPAERTYGLAYPSLAFPITAVAVFGLLLIFVTTVQAMEMATLRERYGEQDDRKGRGPGGHSWRGHPVGMPGVETGRVWKRARA